MSPAARAQAPGQASPSDPSIADAQARIERLTAQVEALQAALDDLKKGMAKATPSWKGAPQMEDKKDGFSFKPRGALQFDAGYAGYPDGNERRGTVGGLNYGNLGWNSRARRLLLGADGTLPGGFKYSAEFNFAQGSVDYEDIFISYDFEKMPLTAQIGNIYPFSSLETMTSSKFTSMMERASITDAFSYNRRLGLGFTLADRKADSWLFQLGLFNEPINNGNFTRTGWQASLRGVYMPKLGDTRLHLGANFQHRRNTRENLVAQYRTRPLTQITDQRFVDTGSLAARGDDVAGVELAAIHKSLHLAAEAQKLWVRGAYDAAGIAAILANPDSNQGFPGSAVALDGNPGFWGGYVEAGYYFTGETRGYKGGKFDRTKVLNPFNAGGIGAIQLNARVDYVQLSDRVDGSSTSLAAPFYVNGGKQLGYQMSLIWNPIDYIRFMAQYGRLDVTGGPRAAIVDPTSLKPVNRRNYTVDTFAVRAQVDF